MIACLFDHTSVHEVLDPLADQLADRTLINLTTTSPEQSREMAAWAAAAGIEYLDGGIMAVPGMIGQPGSSILYSGSAAVFEQHKPLLDLWGDSAYFGDDAGMASLYDLALLAGMYVMFAGFMHGAAMVGAAGVIDGGDYGVPGQQSLEFSDLGKMVEASAAQGISTEVVGMVQGLIRRQIDAGHGSDGFARIVESIQNPA